MLKKIERSCFSYEELFNILNEYEYPIINSKRRVLLKFNIYFPSADINNYKKDKLISIKNLIIEFLLKKIKKTYNNKLESYIKLNIESGSINFNFNIKLGIKDINKENFKMILKTIIYSVAIIATSMIIHTYIEGKTKKELLIIKYTHEKELQQMKEQSEKEKIKALSLLFNKKDIKLSEKDNTIIINKNDTDIVKESFNFINNNPIKEIKNSFEKYNNELQENISNQEQQHNDNNEEDQESSFSLRM